MRLLEDLASMLRAERRDVVAVVGAGVSLRASGGADTASWTGLLHHGIGFIEGSKPTLDPSWAETVKPLVDSRSPGMMLAAAQLIGDELGAPTGGEFGRWLDDSIGSLTVAQRDVIDALVGLEIPILTTNYDNLIEDVSGFPPVTWEDPGHMQQVMRGDRRGIAHLHGHYSKPQTVVLGMKSYSDLANARTAQAMQQALAGTRSFLLVGFGAGLDDPNFMALRSYMADAFSSSHYRHYRLCLEHESSAVAAQHTERERIMTVAACRSHDEMAGVLRTLVTPTPMLPLRDDAPATTSIGAVAPVNHSTYSKASLDDWQRAIWVVFGNDRDIPLYDMMLQLVVESTRLSEAIRKDRFEEALSSLPRILSWICSMAAKVAEDPEGFADLNPSGVPLSDIIWRKYPGLCSLCAERRCVCPTWDTDALTDAERATISAARLEKLDAARASLDRPRSLDEWISMFDSIYGTVNAQRSSATKVLHYWEEVRELEIEQRKADRLRAGVDLGSEGRNDATDRVVNWEDELADVFSWLSSVYLHIKGHLRNAGRLVHELDRRRVFGELREPVAPDPLSTWAWLEFGSKPDGEHLVCHRCKQPVCGCTLGFERR